MRSKGPRQGEGGGDDVKGLLKSVGAGGSAEQREGGTGETGKGGGGRVSGLLPLLCGFLYTPGRLGACSLACARARPPGKVGYGGKELSSGTGKGASSTDRPETQLPFAASSSVFQEGFIFVYSFKILFL